MARADRERPVHRDDAQRAAQARRAGVVGPVRRGHGELHIVHRARREGQVAGHGDRADGVAGRKLAAGVDHRVGHRARAAQRAAAADHDARGGRDVAVHPQRSGLHEGRPGVAAHARQIRDARAGVAQLARPVDRVRQGDEVAAVEEQRRVVADRAGAERAGRPARAHHEGAGQDLRAAGVGVGVGQHRGAGAGVDQVPGAGERVGDGHVVGAVEHQRAVHRDRPHAADAARGAARAEGERAAGGDHG